MGSIEKNLLKTQRTTIRSIPPRGPSLALSPPPGAGPLAQCSLEGSAAIWGTPHRPCHSRAASSCPHTSWQPESCHPDFPDHLLLRKRREGKGCEYGSRWDLSLSPWGPLTTPRTQRVPRPLPCCTLETPPVQPYLAMRGKLPQPLEVQGSHSRVPPDPEQCQHGVFPEGSQSSCF